MPIILVTCSKKIPKELAPGVSVILVIFPSCKIFTVPLSPSPIPSILITVASLKPENEALAKTCPL